MDARTENELSAALAAILERFTATVIFKRLRVRIRELGDNQRDEIAQFKQLQRACREAPDLSKAFVDAGFGDLTKADARAPDAKTGAVVQAFNRFVESRWEE
jgi:hypothetical protein